MFFVGQTHNIVVKSSPNFPFLIQAISGTIISAEAKEKQVEDKSECVSERSVC